MVVISSLCVLALCLPHSRLCTAIFPQDLEPLVGNYGANTNTNPSECQTSFHNWNYKESSRLKNTNTGKWRISGACCHGSPKSLDFIDMVYLLKLASCGEEHSRKSWSHAVYSWITHCSKGLSPSFPFCGTQSLWLRWASEGKGCRETGSFCKHLPQSLKGWKAAPGIHSGTPSRMNLPKQTQHSRKETIISKIFRVDIVMLQGG